MRIFLIIVDFLIFSLIFGVFIANISYQHSNPEYFISVKGSDYTGEPYLYDCAEVKPIDRNIRTVKVGDEYCQYQVGSEMHIKKEAPIVYWAITYEWLLIGVLLLYYIVSHHKLFKCLLEKIKHDK